jgi:hypothetical protein
VLLGDLRAMMVWLLCIAVLLPNVI